jgi:hypothetical protein
LPVAKKNPKMDVSDEDYDEDAVICVDIANLQKIGKNQLKEKDSFNSKKLKETTEVYVKQFKLDQQRQTNALILEVKIYKKIILSLILLIFKSRN